jgi:AraC family transcriptional regulator
VNRELNQAGVKVLPEPDIRVIPSKMLVGQRLTMSLAGNRTFELWKGFMPRRKEIRNTINNDLISMQVFDSSFNFRNFDPDRSFEKWAAVEVTGFSNIPDGMETFLLPAGLYAVFVHRGPASEGEKTFRYIFGEWLPGSGFIIDNRPHFEVLGSKYKNEDPSSEEEVYIPVISKTHI